MSEKLGESAEEIEARCAALRQYATVLGDFYRALIDCHVPPEVSGDAVMAWWEHALSTRESDDDEIL